MAEAGNFFFLEPAFVLDWPPLVTRPGGGTELERIRAPIHDDRSPQGWPLLPQIATLAAGPERDVEEYRGTGRPRGRANTPRRCSMELVVSQCACTLCPQPAAPLDCCRSDTPNPTLMSGGRPEEIRDRKRETVSGRGSRRLTVKTTSEMRALARVPVTCNGDGKRGFLPRGSGRNGHLEEGVRSPS